LRSQQHPGKRRGADFATGLPSSVRAETVDSAGTAATAVGMWTCDKNICLLDRTSPRQGVHVRFSDFVEDA
jgi:hypothetical protein